MLHAEALDLSAMVANAERLQPGFDFDLRGLAGRCLIDEDGWPTDDIPHDDFDDAKLDEAAREHNLSCAPKCEGDAM